MITVEYCAEGIPVSDFAIEQYMVLINSSLQHDHNQHWRFSTSPIFDAIRVEVLEERIDYQQIQFLFNGKEIKLDKYGKMSSTPRGFIDPQSDYWEKLILGGLAKWKKEKEERGGHKT